MEHHHHPGLGEGGIFHEKATEKKLPEGTVLTFALVGNQNSGKTTLFNQLTGSNQHVGNFPGVTVDRKSGSIKVSLILRWWIFRVYIHCLHIQMRR